MAKAAASKFLQPSPQQPSSDTCYCTCRSNQDKGARCALTIMEIVVLKWIWAENTQKFLMVQFCNESIFLLSIGCRKFRYILSLFMELFSNLYLYLCTSMIELHVSANFMLH